MFYTSRLLTSRWIVQIKALIALFCFFLLIGSPLLAQAAVWTWSGAINTAAENINNYFTQGIMNAGDTIMVDHGTGNIVFGSAFATSGISVFTNSTYTGTISFVTSSIAFASSTFDAGTISPGSTNLSFSGGVTMSGGVTASSTISSGTGTIGLTGGSSFNLYKGTATFGGVTTISGNLLNADTLTVGADTTVTGNTTVSGGTLTVNTGKNLTVSGTYANSGGTVTLTGTGKISNTATLVLTDASGNTKTAFTSPNDVVGLKVTDPDRNFDSSARETMTATVRTTGLVADSETVTLTETGNATGIFTANIGFKSATAAVANNGILEMNGNGTVVMTYTDSHDSSDTGTSTGNVVGSAVRILVAPINTSLAINGGATETTNQTVTLSIGSTNAISMLLGNTPDFSGSTWEPINTTRTWTLTPGLGQKTVYIMFESTDGSRTPAMSSSITVSAASAVTPTTQTTTPTTPATTIPPASAPVPPATTTTEPGASSAAASAAIHTLLTAPSFDVNKALDVTPSIAADHNIQPAPAAATVHCTGDSLIKGSGSAVYYCGQDGKRYVFPQQHVFASWYKNFSSVVTMDDASLALIPLGGNVTYRPGTRMVKITTDPKVYVVAPNGTLRWVSSEALAQKYYGTNWKKMVDDIPDSYFTNYTVGDAITE